MRDERVETGRRLARAGGRLLAGVALGAAAVPVELAVLLAGGLLVLVTGPWASARRVVLRRLAGRCRALAGWHLRRLATWHGDTDPGYRLDRPIRYVLLRWPVGLLGATILLLLAYGLVAAAVWVSEWPGAAVATVLTQLAGSAVFAFLALQGLLGTAAVDRALARRLLGPGRTEQLERRITALSTSRAEVVEAVNHERRRIERDLHDGVQQRLVALGVLLGRARRGDDPERVAALLRTAHEESARALDDLRDVAWRVYPAALDDLGLHEALHRVAEASAVPVRLDHRLPDRPAPDVATAAYFVVAEAVTNAAKHAGAAAITVRVRPSGPGGVLVEVRDDGRGGADAAGGGLAGLARRVAALDGRFAVHSPPGGPTTVTAELPGQDGRDG